MARRKQRLFKYGPANVVQLATQKVQAARDIWVNNTTAGFQQFWSDYIAGFARDIGNVVIGLPPKTGSIRTNVARRVVPVAEAVSNYARAYRERRIREAITRIVGAAPAPAGGG